MFDNLNSSPQSVMRSFDNKSPDSVKKFLKQSSYKYIRPQSKNRVKKYYDRATRLSPRSWIKKKNSIGKSPSQILNTKASVIEDKMKGLENIASRLSLVSK